MSAHVDTSAEAAKLILMVSFLDQSGCCQAFELIGDDSPFLELPPDSSERDKVECILRSLSIALESDDAQIDGWSGCDRARRDEF
jgi:hypothetical protein